MLATAGPWSALTSVEAYTPTGWITLPPLPHAASEATACVLNGRLYVMGGTNCDKLQVLEMSEENEFTWTVKADMPSVRCDAASAVVHGKLWLMGGLVEYFEDTATVTIYDPATNTWDAGPELPQPGPYHAAILDGELRVGNQQAGTLRYNGTAWVGAGGAPLRRRGACASVLLG